MPASSSDFISSITILITFITPIIASTMAAIIATIGLASNLSRLRLTVLIPPAIAFSPLAFAGAAAVSPLMPLSNLPIDVDVKSNTFG